MTGAMPEPISTIRAVVSGNLPGFGQTNCCTQYQTLTLGSPQVVARVRILPGTDLN
jgi:hypothetical protein